MKYIITATLLLTSVAHAGIFKKTYKGPDVPKTCEVVFTKEYIETTGSLKGDVAEVLHAAILHTRRILDLKFESHSYYVANRESYGEYMRFHEIKKNVDQMIKDAESSKENMIEKSDALIKDLAVMEKNLANRVYNDLSAQRENEIERYNKIVKDQTRFWDKNKFGYYQAISVWGPYQDNLSKLAQLEQSLMESLNRLAEINTLSETSLKELVSEIRTWRHEEATLTCKTIDEKFQELAKKF